jgi:hypothetical protein
MAEISSAAVRVQSKHRLAQQQTRVGSRHALIRTVMLGRGRAVAVAAPGLGRKFAEDLGEFPLGEMGRPRFLVAGGRRGGRGRDYGARAPPMPAGVAHRRSLYRECLAS